MNNGIKNLEQIKDSLTPDGRIVEHTKEYKSIKQDLKNFKIIQSLLVKWVDELAQSGINSKGMVRYEMQQVLEDLKNVNK